jgi:23S rRNA (adenine2030-N6)-methyltransferase
MNYRHAFHAGNFADLVKHAALTLLLDSLTRGAGPLTVIDTHAGAGAYDLEGEEARKSGEAQSGVAKLLTAADAPEAFDILIAAVARANGEGPLRVYPGSPVLVAAALRTEDRLVAFELNPAVERALADLLAPLAPQAEAVAGDGFALAAGRVPRTPTLVLIDPPFEARDDYARIATASAAMLARNPAAVILIWTPLKDLETFDGFLRRLETLERPALIAETRLRPLTDPMAMNGCALALVNPPAGMDQALAAICGWVVESLGEAGGEARVWNL